MAKNEIRLERFELMQELKGERFLGLDDDYFEDENFNLESFLIELRSRLERDEIKIGKKVEGEIEVVEVAGIVHDKDVQRVFDLNAGVYVETPKRRHVHIFFELNRKVSLPIIAERLGVAPQHVSKLSPGRYGKENTLAYLIHAKEVDKYLYDPRDVETLGTFSYLDYYGERYDAWMRARATKKRKKVDLPQVDLVIERILKGELTRENVLLSDDLFSVYASNKKRIDEAFSLYVERKIMKGMQAMRNGDFELRCLYITGEPGSGKTYFARRLIAGLMERNPGWSVYEAGATNALDDYAGEEIIFMDDPRASAFGSSDWLKLLDPINTSPISARYKNKTPIARTLVMTAYMEIDEFFYYVREKGSDRSEALDQFLRRFAGVVEVFRYDEDSKRFFSYLEMDKLDEPYVIKVVSDDKGSKFVRGNEKHVGDSFALTKAEMKLNYYPKLYVGDNGLTAEALPVEGGLEYFLDYFNNMLHKSDGGG